jgi:hypothetical protein
MAGKYAAKDGSIIPSAKVRLYLYGLMVAASPVVVYYGLATLEETGLWIAFGGVALGISNAVAAANTGNKTDV